MDGYDGWLVVFGGWGTKGGLWCLLGGYGECMVMLGGGYDGWY